MMPNPSLNICGLGSLLEWSIHPPAAVGEFISFGHMANSAIIASMLRVVDDYEAGRISPDQVESSLESHMQALERVALPSIHKMRTFTYRLVSAHLSDGEMEFKDDERVETVLSELCGFLRSLPS